MASKGSTTELKRVLGFKELLSTAIGQIIGAGIMTLLGVGIALTGRSVPIAFIIAAVIIVANTIPMIVVLATVRVRGGTYTMTAMLAGEKLAGASIILYILTNVSMGMYGISFADYFIPFFGIGNTKVVAITVLTIFFIINIVGVDIMAKFQNLIVIFMCVALGLLAAFGVSQVDPAYMTTDFMIDGMGGLLKASGLLTFAVGGANVIGNLSGEAKNPKRDIPLAIIISTLLVAVLYAFISVVAAGVLPVSEVAGKPLTLVAEAVLPKPVFAFFMVAGAMFALASTLNAQYAWAPKPVMQACDDGWLPQKLAYLHPRFKTPVILMGILYGIAVLCVVSGLDISILGNICLVANNAMLLLINAFVWKLPQIVPEEWEKSSYKMSKGALWFVTIIGTAGSIFTIILNAVQLSIPLLIANVVAIIVSLLFGHFRFKSGKVQMEVSYEMD